MRDAKLSAVHVVAEHCALLANEDIRVFSNSHYAECDVQTGVLIEHFVYNYYI
jgi:hypothetical protein